MIRIAELAEAHGLQIRGAFHPDPGDGVPGPAGTLVLLGFAGRSGWAAFARSSEAHDGKSDPLDRWSERIIGTMAAQLGALALFPFGGPPWHPFLKWAQRADTVTSSPIGLLIHPVFGLWHSYRGALGLTEKLALPALPVVPSPCDACAERPCLSACPVAAFRPGRYDVAACRTHLSGPHGGSCIGGCLARQACPVGQDEAYGIEQGTFLMAAFRGTGRPGVGGRSDVDCSEVDGRTKDRTLPSKDAGD